MGEMARIRQEYIAARQANDKWSDKALSKQEELNKALETYRGNLAKINAGRASEGLPPISKAQVKKEEAAIRKEVMSKGGDPSEFRLASADAGVALARIKANLEGMQLSVRQGDAIVQQALQDGYVSLDAAFKARQELLRAGTQAEREAMEAELKEADRALAKAANAADRGPLTQKKIEVEAKIKTLAANFDEQSREIEKWRKGEERRLAGIKATINVEIANLSGKFDAEAVRAQLEEKYRTQMEAAGTAGSDAEVAQGRQRVQMLINAGVAQAEFNLKLQEAQRIRAALGLQEAEVQRQVQAGLLSQIEGEGQVLALRAKQAPALQEVVTQLERIRDAMPTEAGAAISDLTQQIDEQKSQLKAATPVVVDFGRQAKTAIIDSLSSSIQQAGGDFKNFPDLVKQSLKQVAANIVASNVKRLLTEAFTPSTGGTGGQAAGAAAGAASAASGAGGDGALWGAVKTLFGAMFFANGGQVRAYAEGGRIVGPGTGTSDSVPALVGGTSPIAVSDGEWIQPVKAVRHYGAAFMEAVRTLRFPKPSGYAFGGLVRSQQAITRYAAGGQAAAAAVPAPKVQVNFTNTGTPVQAVRQEQQWDGRELVVSVVLADIQDGGPIAQRLGVPRG